MSDQSDVLRAQIKKIRRERDQLLLGIIHAIGMVSEYRETYHDCDPGEGESGSSEYESLQDIQHHLEGTCIDDDGEYICSSEAQP